MENCYTLDQLSPEEYTVLLKYPPVRYIKHKLAHRCEICGGAGSEDNPLQAAHRIPFMEGIRLWGIRPENLNSPVNIVTAHRKGCNKLAELSVLAIAKLHDQCDVIPAYITLPLPEIYAKLNREIFDSYAVICRRKAKYRNGTLYRRKKR